MSGVLDSPDSHRSGSVVLFGSGAIGSAVRRTLEQHGLSRFRPVAVPWDSEERKGSIRDALSMVSGETSRLGVVWAAGRAGFSADETICDVESQAFDDLIEVIGDRSGPGSKPPVSLHVVSSAGGLFEGATRVSVHSTPDPKRPYGFLKARQEERALTLSGSIPVVIYRASTVYAPPIGGHRPGLIGTLIRNGLRRMPTPLYGAMDTLRDYVGNDDVGRHIARDVATERSVGGEVQMLVAGRPTPISHVVELVEETLRRRLLVSFVDAWNARDITFDPAMRAVAFRPEPLRTGVARAVLGTLGAA